MKLTGPEIARQINLGNIIINPYNPEQLNPNSYNLKLAPVLQEYIEPYVSTRKQNLTREIIIPETGFIIEPGKFYLGTTVEYTETHNYAPMLSGRSSGGRLSISIHACAGFGDEGFKGTWTLEIFSIIPVKVFPYDEICQIAYEPLVGEIMHYNGRYQNQSGVVASKFSDKKFEGSKFYHSKP